MTANDVASGFHRPWKQAKVLYASYLIAILVATIGWLGLLAWLAMALLS